MSNFKSLKVVFFGTPDFVNPVLDALKENFDVVMEVRDPSADLSRLTENLQALQPDLIVVAAFGKIIPKSILDIPKYGSLNIHPSLLPKYRGPSPLQTVIINGDKETGITIIKMDEKMDHGPIIVQELFSLSDSINFQVLSKEIFRASTELLLKIIPDFIIGRINPRVQDDARATFCTQITKQDGYFEIDNPPPFEKLDRMIRAYYPWPGVWTKWKGRIVRFLPNSSLITHHSPPYLVQMEGKRAVPLKDFLNGYPDFPLKNI